MGMLYLIGVRPRVGSVYALPKMVELFIERANNEAKGTEVRVSPNTFDHSVSVFRGRMRIRSIDYDRIEASVVECLDYLHTLY